MGFSYGTARTNRVRFQQLEACLSESFLRRKSRKAAIWKRQCLAGLQMCVIYALLKQTCRNCFHRFLPVCFCALSDFCSHKKAILAALYCKVSVITNLTLKVKRLEITTMTYDIKKSGERIRQLRIENGYTQEALAKKLRVDRSLLSHIEAGKRGCSVDLSAQMSDLFGVILDLLILGREQESNDKATLEKEIVQLMKHLNDFKNGL